MLRSEAVVHYNGYFLNARVMMITDLLLYVITLCFEGWRVWNIFQMFFLMIKILKFVSPYYLRFNLEYLEILLTQSTVDVHFQTLLSILYHVLKAFAKDRSNQTVGAGFLLEGWK